MSGAVPRCATCRWWGEDAPDWMLLGAEMDGGQQPRECRSPRLSADCNATEGPYLATVLDGDGYHASLYTDGAFGCVNHEANP